MLPQAAFGLTTSTMNIGTGLLAIGAAASFLANTENVVGWQVRHVAGGTLFVGSPAITNGGTLASVGAVVVSGAVNPLEFYGPVSFQLTAGGATVTAAVVKLLGEGYTGQTAVLP